MIDKFNAAIITIIGAEIEEALSVVAEKYGISIRSSGGTFYDDHASLKLAITLRDSSGEAISPERADFVRFAHEFGLQPTDIDREFLYNGYRWTVAGLKPSRPKYPVLARKKIDGRLYKLTADAVKFALLREDSKTEPPHSSAYPPQLRLMGSSEEKE